MGIPLGGAWWVLFYYATVILLFNIGGEELWWRGYVLPRQELAFGIRIAYSELHELLVRVGSRFSREPYPEAASLPI